MKSLIYFPIIFIILIIGCNIIDNQSTIILKTSEFADSTMIYLVNIEEETIVDSGYIINNNLVFSVKVVEPGEFVIRPEIKKREDIDYKYFWKENKLVTIIAKKGNLKNARVEGSEIQKQADVLETSKRYLKQTLDSIYTEYRSVPEKDTGKREALRTEGKEIEQAITDADVNYIKNNSGELYSVITLKNLMKYNIPKTLTKELYETLTPEIQSTKYGKTVKKFLELSTNVKIGDKAIDFQLPDLDGNLIGLNNFKNKYILLEFWSSGCGPCRMENPNLLKNYKAYHDKGFEIVSISLDKKREHWENVVKKDSMIWTTLSDLKGIDGDVAITYNIYFMPTNYLIDTNGIIIAENLRGEQLSAKLKEIFIN